MLFVMPQAENTAGADQATIRAWTRMTGHVGAAEADDQTCRNGSRCDVLFVIGQLDRGGAERHVVATLAPLRDLGIVAEVFVMRGGGALIGEVERVGIPLHVGTATGGRRKMLSVMAHLIAVLRQCRPRVVHYFLPESYIIGATCALLTCRARHVMSRRSLNRYQLGRPVVKVAERFLHRRMDVLLGNSRAVVAELLEEGAPTERTGLIYNGVIVENDADVTPWRRAAGIADDAFVGITVANLIPYKGHADLLHALAAAREMLPLNWRWLMVGRDDGRLTELRSLSIALGIDTHVDWLGEHAVTAPLYRAADVMVLASHQEGFSNALIEAMAYGLPVVATAVGGNVDAIDDERTGLLVPVGDVAALAAAVGRLGRDPELRQVLGNAARVTALERFSVENATACYAALYRNLMHGAKAVLPSCARETVASARAVTTR